MGALGRGVGEKPLGRSQGAGGTCAAGRPAMKRTPFACFALSLAFPLFACGSDDAGPPATPPAQVFATTAPNAVRLRMVAVVDGAGRDAIAHFPEVLLRFTFDVANGQKTGGVKLHYNVEQVPYSYTVDDAGTVRLSGGSTSIGVGGEAAGQNFFGASHYALTSFGSYRFADAKLTVGSMVEATAEFLDPTATGAPDPTTGDVAPAKAQPATVRFVVTPTEDPPVAATPVGPVLPDGRSLPLLTATVQFATPFLPAGPFELEVDGKKAAVDGKLRDDLWSYFADESSPGLGTTDSPDYSDRVLHVPAGTDWLGRAVPATTVPLRAFRPEMPTTLDFSTDADTAPTKLALLGGARVANDAACEKGRCIVLEPRPRAAGERCEDDALPTAVFGFSPPSSGPNPSFRFRVLGKTPSDADRAIVVHTFGRGMLRLPPLDPSTAVAGYPFDSGWQSVAFGGQPQFAVRLLGCTPGVKYLVQGVFPTVF